MCRRRSTAVLAKMMAKHPEQRFQSMTEVIAALEEFSAKAPTKSLAVVVELGDPSGPSNASDAGSAGLAPTSDGEAVRKLLLFIDGCGGHDKFLDREEEQSIFRKGGELELSLDEIEKLLDDRAHQHGWTRQSKLTAELTQRLEQATDNDGAIDRHEYDQIIDYAVGRKMRRKDAEEHCLTLILDNRWRPQEKLFDKWFRRKVKQYGLE